MIGWITRRMLAAVLLPVCTAALFLYGFSRNAAQNPKQGVAETSLSEAEALFPQFTVSAKPKGHEGDLRLEVITPTAGNTLLLRWGDAVLSVSRTAVETALPPERELPEVSDAEIASAAKLFAPTADTHYLLWTDLCRLTTYVLERAGNEWQLLRRLPCSAGDAAHPSPRGLFRLGVHRLSFGREKHYSAAFALQISGNYLYHSVLLTPGGESVLDGRLGERISHGCIRHSLDDSRWLYETLPDGTAILIR